MLSTAPASVRRGRWWQANPEKLWQAVSLILFVLLLVALGMKRV
jgi:hypothetical protein